jgi:hypothetical protein
MLGRRFSLEYDIMMINIMEFWVLVERKWKNPNMLVKGYSRKMAEKLVTGAISMYIEEVCVKYSDYTR